MWYQMTAAPTAPAEKQRDELERLLTHARRLTVVFVTVAGRYKPVRARLALIELPERVAEPGTRALTILCGQEAATRESKPVRQRPEWTETVVLLPSGPEAAALDGTALDGWESACLSVTYTPGRATALLRCCAEDVAHADRLPRLAAAGWTVQRGANPLQQLAAAAGRPWAGVLSLLPVPGGAVVGAERTSPPPTSMQAADAPAPLGEELAAALTEDPAGLLVGVGRDGRGVRLARRAMTLAVGGEAAAQERAVLALIRRALAVEFGVVVLLPRSMLKRESLEAWEPCMRLLDGQALPDSATLPWREIAPDLLAAALGGPRQAVLPARFAAVLAGAGAEALAVPAVLGLATVPGDDLRGVLRAGGMVVVPQDDDQASQLIGRLLMALLATPPEIGRGLLLLTTPALVPPPALRSQAVQVVVGERGDALLRLVPTADGWVLRGRDGQELAALLPDLLTMPAEGKSELVDLIVRALDTDAPAAPAPAPAPEALLPWDAPEADVPKDGETLMPWDEEADAVGVAHLASGSGVTSVLSWRGTPEPLASPETVGGVRTAQGAPSPVDAGDGSDVPMDGDPLMPWDEEADAVEVAHLASGGGVVSVLTWQGTPERLASPETVGGVTTPQTAPSPVDAGDGSDVPSVMPWNEAAEPAEVAHLASGGGVASVLSWQGTPDTLASPETVGTDTPLDQALDALYDALAGGAAVAPVEDLMRGAITQGADGVARAIAAQWVVDAPQDGRAWLWRAVLARDLGELDAWLRTAEGCALEGTLAARVAAVQAARSPVPMVLPPFDVAAATASIAALFADEEPPFGAEDDLLASDADLYEEDEPLAVAADLYEEDEPIAEGLFGGANEPIYDRELPPAEGTAVPTWLQALEPVDAAPAWLADAPLLDDPAPLLDDPAPLLDDPALAVAAAGEEGAMLILDDPASAVVVHAAPTPMPALDDVPALDAMPPLDDPAPGLPTAAALLAAWQAGTTVPQLVAQLVAQGVPSGAARAHVRAAITPSVAAPAPVPPAPAPVLAAPAPAVPVIPAPPAPVPLPSVAPAPVSVAAAPAPVAAPPLPGSALDADQIWAAWQASVPTEELIRQMCGRKQGVVADAARAMLYRVLVPRAAAALGCQGLVDVLVCTGQPSADPLYQPLMRMLARTDRTVAGQVERQLLQRIVATAGEA